MLAGIFILAHVIIPHDHHFEQALSDTEPSACENGLPDRAGEPSGTHCHALNVLVWEKPGVAPLAKPMADYSSVFLPGTVAGLPAPTVTIRVVPLAGYREVFRKKFLLSARILRAPPCPQSTTEQA